MKYIETRKTLRELTPEEIELIKFATEFCDVVSLYFPIGYKILDENFESVYIVAAIYTTSTDAIEERSDLFELFKNHEVEFRELYNTYTCWAEWLTGISRLRFNAKNYGN